MISPIAAALLSHAARAATAHTTDSSAGSVLTVVLSVISGVLVLCVGAMGRSAWRRRRGVPTALSKVVRRETYLGEVLAESRREQYDALDVLAPRLTPAADGPTIGEIQQAWKAISGRGQVRVLTLDSRKSLQGGLELVGDGIEVRVARRDINSEDLSYHVFVTGGSADTVILNHHRDDTDRPVRTSEPDVIKIFHKNFESIWDVAVPIEAVIAEKVIDNARGSREPAEILRALNEVLQTFKVAAPKLGHSLDIVLRHLAFRNSCSAIFVVGLPGSGKSMARRELVQRLKEMGIAGSAVTDYVYAYRDFLYSLIMLEPRRIDGFEASAGGAFAVKDETALRPALQALEAAVRASLKECEVTVAEFARSDYVAAFDQFDDIRSRCWILYVQAPADLRADRLGRRVEPPELTVEGTSVTLTPSDNHRLPSVPLQSIYATDDIETLAKSRHWRGRIVRIENPVDDGGAAIRARIEEFIVRVTDPYRPPSVLPVRAGNLIPGSDQQSCSPGRAAVMITGHL